MVLGPSSNYTPTTFSIPNLAPRSTVSSPLGFKFVGEAFRCCGYHPTAAEPQPGLPAQRHRPWVSRKLISQ
jgi:hypothetical protein